MGESISGVFESGIYRYGNVRISDLSGEKRLPIGNDNFVTCVENSVFVDKSMFIADILDSGTAAMLYCRPRRFGKSLNLSMLQRFFEIPSPSEPMAMDTTPLFRGLTIWDAKGGLIARITRPILLSVFPLTARRADVGMNHVL